MFIVVVSFQQGRWHPGEVLSPGDVACWDTKQDPSGMWLVCPETSLDACQAQVRNPA